MQYQERDVGGVPVRWLESGAGFPVVLVHGIPTSARLWRQVIPEITGARCLAFEMLGYGSYIPGGRGRDISVAKQAEYLLAWLRELGIDRAVLVGHDLGGGVVQIAAVRDPAVCAGMVLTNCISRDSWPVPPVRMAARLGGVLGLLPSVTFRWFFPAMQRLAHDTATQARDAAEVHGAAYEEHDAWAAFVRQVRSLRTEDTLAIAGQLNKLDVPARVVWGTGDKFQTIAYGERLAADLGVDVRRIEDARHFTPEDHPVAIATAINEVLDEVQRR